MITHETRTTTEVVSTGGDASLEGAQCPTCTAKSWCPLPRGESCEEYHPREPSPDPRPLLLAAHRRRADQCLSAAELEHAAQLQQGERLDPAPRRCPVELFNPLALLFEEALGGATGLAFSLAELVGVAIVEEPRLREALHQGLEALEASSAKEVAP